MDIHTAKRPYNLKIAKIERNGMTTKLLRFTLTYKYFSKW